jgi:hypothetical protein
MILERICNAPCESQSLPMAELVGGAGAVGRAIDGLRKAFSAVGTRGGASARRHARRFFCDSRCFPRFGPGADTYSLRP